MATIPIERARADSVAAAGVEPLSPHVLEEVLMGGDLGKLTPGDRVRYYAAVCQSLHLNPLTRPFDYLRLNGKLTLYARREATDQLRTLRGVAITGLRGQLVDDVYVVTAEGCNAEGRTDVATGAVSLASLRGEDKANALMKAETKAKRRLTLSLVGLGMIDESEIGSIQGAQVASVDTATGEILSNSANASAPTTRDAKESTKAINAAMKTVVASLKAAREAGFSDHAIAAAVAEATPRPRAEWTVADAQAAQAALEHLMDRPVEEPAAVTEGSEVPF